MADPAEGSPLFLDQTEAEGPKKVFETAPPPPLSQGQDDRPPIMWISGSATVEFQASKTPDWSKFLIK